MNTALASELTALMGTEFVGEVTAHWQDGDVRKVTRTEKWRAEDRASEDFSDRVLATLDRLHRERFTGSTRVAFTDGAVVEVDIVAHLKARQMGTLLME